MKKDKINFERMVNRHLKIGHTPIASYLMAEAKFQRKHGFRCYFNFQHFVRDTRIKI